MAVLDDLPHELILSILRLIYVPPDQRYRDLLDGYESGEHLRRKFSSDPCGEQWFARLSTTCKALYQPSMALLVETLAIRCPSCCDPDEVPTAQKMLDFFKAKASWCASVSSVFVHSCVRDPGHDENENKEYDGQTGAPISPSQGQWDSKVARFLCGLPKLRSFGLYDVGPDTFWKHTCETTYTRAVELVYYDSGYQEPPLDVLKLYLKQDKPEWTPTRLNFNSVSLCSIPWARTGFLTHLTINHCDIEEENMDRLLIAGSGSLVLLDITCYTRSIRKRSWLRWFATTVTERHHTIKNLVHVSIDTWHEWPVKYTPADYVGLINKIMNRCPRLITLKAPKFTATAELFEQNELISSGLKILHCHVHAPSPESVKRAFDSRRNPFEDEMYFTLVPSTKAWKPVAEEQNPYMGGDSIGPIAKIDSGTANPALRALRNALEEICDPDYDRDDRYEISRREVTLDEDLGWFWSIASDR